MTYKTLTLEVKDKETSWDLKQPEAGDPENKGTMLLELDGHLKETIDLLVNLQHWLGGAIAENLLESDKMEELHERLNDLTRVLGQSLYAVLFSGRPKEGDDLSDVLLRELDDQRDGDLLRIRLQFTGSREGELSSWPWEYMFIPRDKSRGAKTGIFLANRAQLVLTRFVFFRGSALTIATDAPVRVLLVCAEPQGKGPVHHEEVLKKIKELEGTGAIILKSLIEPKIEEAKIEKGLQWRPTASFDNFKKMVREEFKPHVIHFIGHGRLQDDKGELAFVGAGGEPDWRPDFAKEAAHDELKLVFLQACESALLDPHTPVSSVARQCADYKVPAVIAMQAKIENEAARVFACTFYTELAKEKTVDYAVLSARQAMEDQKQPGAFGVPVLYLRSYEKLIELSKKRDPIISGQYTCDRCNKLINRGDPKVCPRCRLSFYCPECSHKLADPPDPFCDDCGKPTLQPSWSEKALPSNVVQMDTIIPAVRSAEESELPAPPQAMDMGKRVIDIKAESGN